MEQRRFILFLTLSMAVLLGWMNFGPMIFPGLFPPPHQRQVKKKGGLNAGKKEGKGNAAAPEQPADGKGKVAENGSAKDTPDGKTPEPGKEPKPEKQPEKADEPPKVAANAPPPEKHERRNITLGSLDPETGYFLHVVLTSTGAAVEEIAFSDARYKDLEKRDPATGRRLPLKVIGPAETDRRTLQTSVDRIDEYLKGFRTSLNKLDWKVVETVPDKQLKSVFSGATFQMVVETPDGKLEIRKRYALTRVAKQGGELAEARDTDALGYQLQFELTLKNLGAQAQAVSYTLQGPVGLPLENAENTRMFRKLEMGFFDSETGEVTGSSMTAAAVAKAADGDKLEQWKKPIKYIGVDVQYFTALLVPGGDQLKSPYIAVAQPLLVARRDKTSHSDVSLTLTSHEIDLAPGEQVSHSYRLFAGPKRQKLLEVDELNATAVLQYGWFGVVAKGMLSLMKFLHGIGIAYGVAIIFMTVMVRGCMYPLSRKQAAGAKKMKELQPKIQELRKKYANDKEKMARAQMELFSKHNYNPFAGCLPIFLQFPIFIGLYRALSASVDLRLAPFPLTWIDNLAAPDALFKLPFALPFLGQYFNLLPIVTIVLFITQQKMFMPPPTDKEQGLQQKMMSYMMVFMGFLFYRVPAGLCVYFIASSLWGIGERKMLDIGKSKSPGPDGGGAVPEKKTERQATPNIRRTGNGAPVDKRKPDRKGKKKKSRSRR